MNDPRPLFTGIKHQQDFLAGAKLACNDRGRMRIWHLAVVSWIVTALIGVLGTTAARTIWFYQEPVVDTVVQPNSYFTAAISGLIVLVLSLLLSCALTVAAGRSATRHTSASD